MSGYNAVWARNTENAPRGAACSQTVAFSHYNNLSAQLPIDPKTGELVAGGAKEQAEQCFKNIQAILKSIDQDMDNVVRLTVFATDLADLAAVDEVAKGYYGADYVPTRTNVGVAALPKDARVMVEALVSFGLGSIPNAPQANDLIKVVNNTDRAPRSEACAQSVSFSHYNYLSAQLPIDPATGELVAGGVEEQTRQALRNIKNILEAMDVPFDDIVKITVFLKDLGDLDAVNGVYTTFFPDSGIARTVGYLPARTVVQAAALPKDALVQIEAVVSHGDGTPPQAVEDRHGLIVEANDTDAAPVSKLSSQTVAFSHYNHISGQLGADASGKLVAGGAKEQAEQALKNIDAIVQSVDHKMADTVKVNIFLTDLGDLEAVEEAYAAFFPEGTPARRVVGVGALPEGAKVQIEAVLGNEEGTPPVK